MKKLLLLLAIVPTLALAEGDKITEKFECKKTKEGEAVCTQAKEVKLNAAELLKERQTLENGKMYLVSQVAETDAKIAELNAAIDALSGK